MIKGQLRADGIVVYSFQCSFHTAAGLELKADMKLVDTVSGRTVASTTVQTWPPEVVQKVKELSEAMERAVGGVLFTPDTVPSGDSGAKTGLQIPATSSPGGIGELLWKDVPEL